MSDQLCLASHVLPICPREDIFTFTQSHYLQIFTDQIVSWSCKTDQLKKEMLNNGSLLHEADYDDNKAFTMANRGHIKKYRL